MNQPSWIGRTLSNRYKIDALLGQGGMSAVYRATDPNLKRVVAIKLIHPHLSSDPMFVQRFESEAAAVASLRHSNIVQVYDFNNDDGTYYMVLEFIAGETLQDRMKRLVENGRQLSLEESLKFMINISDAMGYAHQRGMVHRDIKPANIMLDVQGQAILMDFGIVKILGGDSHTTTGALVGTARYMSPEIIRGTSADHRADIYSLGVTFFEMLSGRPPFVADSAMTLMMMHLNDPVPNVQGFRSDVPVEIKHILEKCLEKDRDNRYQSAEALSTDLRQALDGKKKPAVSTATMKVPAKEREKITPPPAPVIVDSQPQQSYTPPPPTSSTGQVKPARVFGTFGIVGIIVLGIACLIGVFVLGGAVLNEIFAGSTPTETPTLAFTETPAILIAEPPTETATPEPTATPTGPYVVITSITLENNLYVVNYEVGNFGDQNFHVHMFFDTVPPENAGSPANGPWKLTWGSYGNPPFTQYGPANKPANATQMCALVANPNHSVILNTGNCFDLPE
ncbi:MAG: serine/threonine protein kinase [Anaerolineales bacterium]|nr:serine/threonine protein kinase [Anaerolineales bacterium]